MNGESLFSAASNKRNEEIINFFLDECHANPKLVENSSYSSADNQKELNMAINKKDVDSIQKLVMQSAVQVTESMMQRKKGYIINLLNGVLNKSKSLIDLIRSGDLEAIKNFMEEEKDNVNVNLIDPSGEYPLLVSIEKENMEIVKFLVEKCNAKFVVSKDIFDPLTVAAAFNKSTKIAEYIIKKFESDAKNCINTAFARSLVCHNLPLIKFFVKKCGVSVNSTFDLPFGKYAPFRHLSGLKKI